MCTDNEQVKIKSDPGTPEQDPAIGTLVPLTYTKSHEKRHVPYSHTAAVLRPLIPYGNPMLGPVLAFPHGPPYCFRLFHAATRFKFRCFFSHCLYQQTTAVLGIMGNH